MRSELLKADLRSAGTCKIAADLTQPSGVVFDLYGRRSGDAESCATAMVIRKGGDLVLDGRLVQAQAGDVFIRPCRPTPPSFRLLSDLWTLAGTVFIVSFAAVLYLLMY